MDIFRGDLKLTLALIWALILHYQIAGPAPTHEDGSPAETKEAKKKRVSAKKLMLDWVKAALPHTTVSNFTTDWNDGLKLSALVDYCKPGLIPEHASLDPSDKLTNITRAMNLAEKELGVPQVMGPEDLAVDKPDEHSVMTYVSGFCRPDSAGQNSLLNWVNSKIPNRPVSNFTSDWTDGTALAALIDSLTEGDFPECESMKKDNNYKNCQDAVAAGKEKLGVECKFTPEDFAENMMDQITRSTYITKYRTAPKLDKPSLASQMKAVGPGITGDSVGKETNFVVRGPRIPSWAKVSAKVKGPGDVELPVKQQSTSFKATQFQYSPEDPADYQVDVDFNGEPISGSPFNLTHVPPTNVDGCIARGNGLSKAHVGETAGFSVNCEEGGPGELQVDIETPSGNLETEIEEAIPKNYNVNFTPAEPGDHVISVLWDSKNIPSSPFMCNVTDPKQCSVSGAGLSKGSVGQPQVFSVRTDKAGSGDLTVKIDGPSGPVEPDIREVTKNVFNVTYVPKEHGPHSIDVLFADDPITGSPFVVDVVIPPDASKCKVSNVPEGTLRVGKEYEFDVDASDAGTGDLLASATGKSVPEPCVVKDSGSGNYSVQFTPADIGPLKVEASYGGQNLPQMPMEFTANDPTKVLVNRKAIEAGTYFLDQPVQFMIDAGQAGEGVVTATSNPGGPVALKEQGNKSYFFDMNLSKEGDYDINVEFDGQEVLNMPMHVVCNYRKLADSVVVTKPPPSKIGYLVDTPYAFKAITTGAGHADLEVTSIGKNTNQRPIVKVTKEDDDHYQAAVTASEPDDYEVSVRWGGDHVEGSPFQLLVEGKPEPKNVVCTEPQFVLGSSQPVTLEADATHAGAGTLSASCHGNSVGDVPVEVVEREPKNYNVSFSPPEGDIYTLNVMWQKSDVLDSPFKLNLIPPDSSKCVVAGPEVPIDPTEPIILHIDTSNAGNGKIAASATGDKTGDKPVTIEETKPNVYVAAFVPELTDFYTMDVTWSGQDIPGAPFKVNSSAANADKIAICEPPTAMLEAGQAIGICFDTSAGGNGILTASCRGERIGEIPITVRQRSVAMDKYDVKFSPPEPDVFIVKILWSGVDVKGSPFTINLMPVDVKKIKIIGPSMPRGPGGPVELMLQTAGAGKGKMTGTCSGKDVGPVEVVIKETSTDVYELCFIPPKPDIYTFPVQYGGQKLIGSPFVINTLPTDVGEVKVKEPDSIDLSKKLTFDVDGTEAGSGNLEATCEGEKDGPVSVETKLESPGIYKVFFTPQQQDLYAMKMLWGGQEVPGSPFEVDLRPPMADKVKVGDLHVPDDVGGNNYVWVDLDCTGAGHGPLKADAKGSAVGRMPLEADRMTRTKYRMKFPPKERDLYVFAVAYGDNQVTGSPFKINLMLPDASKVEHVSTMLPELEGGPVSLLFDTSKAGKGEMSASISSERTSDVPSKIEPVSFTEHKIVFVPDTPDVYEVDVKWSGDSVKDSPFKVDTRPPLHPELVEIGKLTYTSINEPACLTLNTSKAGPGKVTSKCVGPDSNDVTVDIQKPKTAKEDYKITFVPTDPGKYDLFAYFDGKAIQEEPFCVDLTPVVESCDQVIIERMDECMLIPEDMMVTEELTGGKNKVVEPKIECREEISLEVGNPFYLEVLLDPDTSNEVVTATVEGDNTGSQEVELTMGESGDVYIMNFNPELPDRYTINVEHNGSPLKDSPFIVNYMFPVDPSKCRIFNLDKIPPTPQVHEPINFGVDAKEAGKGKLLATSDGPSMEGEPSDLRVNPSQKGEPDVYDIVYIPTAMGRHRVFLLWSGDKIPGSPLTFEVGDKRKMQRFPYGKPVTLDITSSSAKNLDAYAIHEESGAKSKVKVNKEKNGQFKLSFQPKHPGVYAIHVNLKKNPIPGSPFRILYLGPSNPSAVKVRDFSDKGVVNVPIKFFIDAEEAGTGELAIHLEGPETVKDSDIISMPHEDTACYDISYIPKTPGDHQFHIMWAGKPIPSGPFVANVVEDMPKCDTVLAGKATNVVQVGQPAVVTLTSTGPPIVPESISAECEGKKTGATSSDIEIKKKEGQDQYVVQCTPNEEDDYALSVLHNKNHVQGSPFTIKAIKQEALAPDYVHPDEKLNSDIDPGVSVNVVRKNPEHSASTVPSVSVMGPYEKCPSTLTTDDSGDVGIQFVPTVSGDYIISAENEGGASLPGCPCKVTVGQKPADPTKVGILDDDMSVFNTQIPFGQPARFRISTVDAGPGTLNITSRGPGKATVKVFDNKDGTYTCDFTPSIAGKYHIDILWNDNHIKGSPYTLHFKSKKEKVIAGLNLENESFRIDIPHRFKLHCGEVGEGVLELSCKPPSAAKIRLIPLPKAKNSYQCEILPKEVGNHEVQVMYNGKHILGSPFNVQFEARGDASKCVLIESSVSGQNTDQEKVKFVVSSEGAGKGKLTASISQTASKDTIPVTVSDLPDNKHVVEFSPKENEEYSLSIKYDNQQIQGSPFKLMFGGDKADAAQCSAQGDGLEVCLIGQEAGFTITSVKPNHGELNITICEAGLDGTETVIPIVKGLGTTKTDITYIASKPGKYDVSVKWAQEHIPGSPFQMQCYNPSDPSRFVVEETPPEAYLGSPFSFTVKSAAGRPTDGSLVVSAQSSSNVFYQGRVEDDNLSDSAYLCTLELPDLGKYLIYTRWSGSHIRNSPFKLKVVTPPNPAKVKAYGPGLENGFVGQEGNFTVETGEAGTGTLAVRVHGPKGAFKINMRRHPDNDRTILVRFDPTHIGKYTVDITWSDMHVPGSPFEVEFIEQ